ncbi:MAG: SbmA/BacA-like family transporter [Beijerinckiaceae bacterium]|nr:SbmA/BacA-like family transporter [Beijerinckiaceae bacterium]
MQPDKPATLKPEMPRGTSLRPKMFESVRPGLDAIRMLRMLAGVFKTSKRWRAVALIVTAVTITILEVVLILRLASWNADFFNLLDQRAVGGLPAQALSFLAIVLGIMVLQASSLESKLRLQLVLRTYLTATLRDAWMTDGRHYRLRYIAGEHGNEDGRIAEDARVVCEWVVEFFVSLLYAVTQLILFVGVLWLYSGPLYVAVGSFAFTIPGHMVWIALIYASLGAAITIFIGSPLVRATDARQTAEANHRAMLIDALTHSQAIALARSEAGERTRLAQAFDSICAAWSRQRASLRNLIILNAGYGHLTAVLPLLMLAPRYLAGDMQLGTLMQVTIAFGQVTAALSWLSSNYSSVAQWEASVERVLQLQDAVENSSDPAFTDQEGTFTHVRENGPALTFSDLTLVLPDGHICIEHFTAVIMPGESALLETTPQAAEALFRAVAGLSLWGAGRIELPEDAEPFFMGEHPHIPPAPLIEVILQPLDAQALSPRVVAQTLASVGLAHLTPLLSTTSNWEEELGLEDQQRIAFASALLQKPRWILMHEATSALSSEAEAELIELLRRSLPDSALIVITHRTISRKFERRIVVRGQ